MHLSTSTLLTLLAITITVTATALPSPLTTTTTTNTTQYCYLFEGCGAGTPVSIADMWTARSRICGDGPDSRWKTGGDLMLGNTGGHVAINGLKCGGNQALCYSSFETIINQCFGTGMLGFVVTEDKKCTYFAARCY